MSEIDQIKKSIPIKPGLYKMAESPKGEPRLLASRCSSCGEFFFPKRQICQNCQKLDLDEKILGPKGKIFSYSVVMQRPGKHYRGPVPYAFGWVELPEGIRIETLFTQCDFKKLEIGLDVEMVIEKIYENENGDEVVCHKFRPTMKQV